MTEMMKNIAIILFGVILVFELTYIFSDQNYVLFAEYVSAILVLLAMILAYVRFVHSKK